MSEQMRKEFEDWMSDYGDSPKAIDRNATGDYKLMQSAVAWRTWKAAWPAGAASQAPSAPVASPVTPKHIEEIKDLLLWPVTEDDARAARDMLQSLHFDLSMTEGAPVAPDERAAFEAWAVTDEGGWMAAALKRNVEVRDHENFGDYSDDDVHSQWEAWQARAALSVQAEPSAVENMLATNELDELGEEVARLQRALCFWLPSVTDREDEVAQRILEDAFLLVGIDGNIPDDFKNAQELGWVTLAAAPTPPTTGEA